jgi:hypothetical protein
MTKATGRRVVKRAVRDHLDMARRLIREGDAVRNSVGVDIEARYRQAAYLAAAEELKAASVLIERVAWAMVEMDARP